MNNNEACAAYFKGNPAYRRCSLEFEKKWNSYGRAKGIITLKHTSEEERRAIGGILGKTFYEDAIQRNYENLYIINANETLETVLIENNIDKQILNQYIENNTTNKGILLRRRYYGIIANK